MANADSILAAFGRSVRKQRAVKNFTQEKLAERANLDSTYISGIERGLRNPGIKNVVRIAEAFGISTAELCRGIEKHK
jgi:transcriptional regulator with XRE-family HTH domain